MLPRGGHGRRTVTKNVTNSEKPQTMWEPDESVSVRGTRCLALISRRLLHGTHLYPTATLRMPVTAEATATWRLRINKMRHGLAVGVKSPALARGRVFGRQASVGLVWWLSNSGQIYNGSEEVPLFPSDPAWSESLNFFGDPSRIHGWSFRSGDVVQIRMDAAQLSFRVNNRGWSSPVSVAPMAAQYFKSTLYSHFI
jgi:hypothetical protein